MRPELFEQPFVAIRNLPYLCEDSNGAGHSSGGVLGVGQTVWGENQARHKSKLHPARAYVEGVGIVSLDPRWLVRADTLNTVTHE